MEDLTNYSADAFTAVDNMVDKFAFTAAPVSGEVVDYRIGLLTEEYQETVGAYQSGDPEGIVDGHVDLLVIVMGNLAMFGVDARVAFNRVMAANMAKVPGKRRDSDPEGVSMVKPEGWVGPDHHDNHGVLDAITGTK